MQSLLLLTTLLAVTIPAHATGTILRIKLEWLNAKECGLEGCKPQNIVMYEGTQMTFSWPEFKERGFFEVRPSLRDSSVHLSLRRLLKTSDNRTEKVAETDSVLALGQPSEVTIGEVRLQITITREPPAAKKQPVAQTSP